MRVIVPGNPEKTRLRQVECGRCGAVLEITGADVKTYPPEHDESVYTSRLKLHYVTCVECGMPIRVGGRVKP